jgi:hypothetical protein
MKDINMKAFFFVCLVLSLSGCVEYKCYSSPEWAIKQGDEFCSQAGNDVDKCLSLIIAETNVCVPNKYKDDKCVASRAGISLFIRIPYQECIEINKRESCLENKACDYRFKNPLYMRWRID